MTISVMKRGEWTFYLGLVSVLAQSLNLNWSPSLNWSWKHLKAPTAVEDRKKNLS